MTIKEMKRQEAALLSSNKSNLHECGIVYRDILIKCKHASSDWLSDEVLISDAASDYIARLRVDYDISLDKESIKSKIRYASKLIVKDFLTKKEVAAIVDSLDKKPSSFEDARNKLRSHYQYSKIRPEILRQIVCEICAL